MLPAVAVVAALCAVVWSPVHAQPDSAAISAASQLTDEQVAEVQADLDRYLERHRKATRAHKAFAFASAGFLLAGDALGTYHFFDLRNKGHDYCDQHSGGVDEDRIADSIYSDGIQSAWYDSESQLFRVLHGGAIALGAICYTATASIELTTPRWSRDKRPFSAVNDHKYLFFLHAGLMLANIALGFVESYALSEGNHDLVQGVGIAHMVVGFALPVVMTASGIVYKLPL